MPSRHTVLLTFYPAKCAKHLPNPSRCPNPRYLPPNKTPSDPKLAVMPLRKKLKARSVSPSKRSVSGSTSPTKEEVDDEFENVVAPASMEIDLDEARRVTNEFRSSCLNRATFCPAIGPGIQACHIIPQHHYHVYPVAGGDADDAVPLGSSNRRLKEAWQSTWSPRNGILLMKHLHDFFDARLFSIHPRTLRIRVFVPYDALTRFNGERASVPNTIDRKALRHHFATDLLATPTSGDPGNGRVGDPTKKSRPNYPDQSQRGDSSMPAGVLHTLNIVELVDERGHKRKGLDVDETCSLDEWREQYAAGRFITPKNSEEFLEDVNWRLFKFKKRRKLIS
uniref:HNH nuclease domain-containing protein n=1 Tax=Gibberella zeae TaxID=5518 RepID=A0A4E9EJU9_GIBZA